MFEDFHYTIPGDLSPEEYNKIMKCDHCLNNLEIKSRTAKFSKENPFIVLNVLDIPVHSEEIKNYLLELDMRCHPYQKELFDLYKQYNGGQKGLFLLGGSLVQSLFRYKGAYGNEKTFVAGYKKFQHNKPVEVFPFNGIYSRTIKETEFADYYESSKTNTYDIVKDYFNTRKVHNECILTDGDFLYVSSHCLTALYYDVILLSFAGSYDHDSSLPRKFHGSTPRNNKYYGVCPDQFAYHFAFSEFYTDAIKDVIFISSLIYNENYQYNQKPGLWTTCIKKDVFQ